MHADIQCTALLQLQAIMAERDSLREDLIHHRTSKRTVDKQWRIEREKSERLESELAFYQNHSARALADRDKVCYLFNTGLPASFFLQVIYIACGEAFCK